MGGKHTKVQILTIQQLLSGLKVDYPTASQRTDVRLRKAAKAQIIMPEPTTLFETQPEANEDLPIASDDGDEERL
jgi:hypothetical protein